MMTLPEPGRLYIVEDLSEYTTYDKLLKQGFTIYRSPVTGRLYTVPPGTSHSNAWRAAKG